MRNPQMPHHSLECLGVRRDVCRIDRRDDNGHVGNLRGISSVAAHDPEDRTTALLGELK